MAMTESESKFLSDLMAKRKERSDYVTIDPELVKRRKEILSSPEIPKGMPDYPPTSVKKGDKVYQEQVPSAPEEISVEGSLETKIPDVFKSFSSENNPYTVKEESLDQQEVDKPVQQPKPEEATDWRAWMTLLTPLATGALTGQMDAGGRFGLQAIDKEVARRDELDAKFIAAGQAAKIAESKARAKEEAKQKSKPLTQANFLKIEEDGIGKYVKADEYGNQPLYEKDSSGKNYDKEKELIKLRAELSAKGLSDKEKTKKEKDLQAIENTLRKEARTPNVNDYEKGVGFYSALDKLAQEPPSRGRDVAAMYNFMKTLDNNSAVMGNETSIAQNIGEVPPGFRDVFLKWLNNKDAILDKGAIQQMNRSARIVMKAREDKVAQHYAKFEEIAKRKGIDPRNITTYTKLSARGYNIGDKFDNEEELKNIPDGVIVKKDGKIGTVKKGKWVADE
jgi:hypothetical protein